jgi:putative cardiolipin synthase
MMHWNLNHCGSPGRSYGVAALFALALAAGCTTFTPGADFPRTASTAFSQPEQTNLGAQAARLSAANGGASGFSILNRGLDGFLARVQMAHAAQRSLDLQYFIFREDESGLLVADAVLRAADRGVKVRVLLDDGETVDGDEKLLALSAHPNIEVRVFNPFAYRGHNVLLRGAEFAARGRRLDFRMHNKLMVADNAVALSGGRNVGDEYFQINPVSQLADDDVLTVGPLVRALSGVFDRFWNNALSVPVEALDERAASKQALQECRATVAERVTKRRAGGFGYYDRVATGEPLNSLLSGQRPLAWARAQLVYDSPDKASVEKGEKVGRLMGEQVEQAVRETQGELLMVSPYFVPRGEGMVLFHDLRERGVKVEVLTNSLESNNVLAAQAGYMHYRKPLLRDGVDLYELRALPGNAHGSGESAAMTRYGNYSLHGKLFVFDRKRVFIGSMNYDPRSLHLNTELGLIIDSPELAREAATRFEAMTSPPNAYRVVLRDGAAGGAGQGGEGEHLAWLTQENGNSVQYDQEPAKDDWQRIAVGLLRLLPIDGEL